jgi:hypothetical protein
MQTRVIYYSTYYTTSGDLSSAYSYSYWNNGKLTECMTSNSEWSLQVTPKNIKDSEHDTNRISNGKTLCQPHLFFSSLQPELTAQSIQDARAQMQTFLTNQNIWVPPTLSGLEPQDFERLDYARWPT